MKITNAMRDAFIRAAMADVPETDYSGVAKKLALSTAVSLLPNKVRAAWTDEKTRPYLQEFYYAIGSGIGSCQLPGIRTPDIVRGLDAALMEIAKAHAAQFAQRSELNRKLRGVAYSVTTRKALVEALPEFEKYLPPDEATANRALPVVQNVMAEFIRAGWPKGKKK